MLCDLRLASRGSCTCLRNGRDVRPGLCQRSSAADDHSCGYVDSACGRKRGCSGRIRRRWRWQHLRARWVRSRIMLKTAIYSMPHLRSWLLAALEGNLPGTWGCGDVVGSPVTLHPQVALSRAQRSARSHLRRNRHYQKVSLVSFGSPAQASHSVTTTTMRQPARHSVSSSRAAIAAGTARATSASSSGVRYSFVGASRT